MNVEQLKKNVGDIVRLRPYALLVERSLPQVRVLTSDGPIPQRVLVATDYDWRIQDVTDKGVKLHCLYTDHTITLGADNVREYRSPHFLLLKCQLILDGNKIDIEPSRRAEDGNDLFFISSIASAPSGFLTSRANVIHSHFRRIVLGLGRENFACVSKNRQEPHPETNLRSLAFNKPRTSARSATRAAVQTQPS